MELCLLMHVPGHGKSLSHIPGVGTNFGARGTRLKISSFLLHHKTTSFIFTLAFAALRSPWQVLEGKLEDRRIFDHLPSALFAVLPPLDPREIFQLDTCLVCSACCLPTVKFATAYPYCLRPGIRCHRPPHPHDVLEAWEREPGVSLSLLVDDGACNRTDTPCPPCQARPGTSCQTVDSWVARWTARQADRMGLDNTAFSSACI